MILMDRKTTQKTRLTTSWEKERERVLPTHIRKPYSTLSTTSTTRSMTSKEQRLDLATASSVTNPDMGTGNVKPGRGIWPISKAEKPRVNLSDLLREREPHLPHLPRKGKEENQRK